jgi:hypothetical protein
MVCQAPQRRDSNEKNNEDKRNQQLTGDFTYPLRQVNSPPSPDKVWRKVNQWSRYKVQEIYSGVRAYGTERADIRETPGRLDTK